MTDDLESIHLAINHIYVFYNPPKLAEAKLMDYFRKFEDYLKHFEITIKEVNMDTRTIYYQCQSFYHEIDINQFINNHFDPIQIRIYTISNIIR